MTYPRNKPYTLEELSEKLDNLFTKVIGNFKHDWKDKLSPETIKLIIDEKRINDYTFQQMRGNSYDWKTIYPMLDNEALIIRTKYTLDNCCSIKSKGRYTPNTTYEESLYNSLVPLLMDRLEEAEAELHKVKKDAREAVNTSWRVVNNIPNTKESKEWPFAGFVKSVKYHLSKIDYIFDKEEDDII